MDKRAMRQARRPGQGNVGRMLRPGTQVADLNGKRVLLSGNRYFTKSQVAASIAGLEKTAAIRESQMAELDNDAKLELSKAGQELVAVTRAGLSKAVANDRATAAAVSVFMPDLDDDEEAAPDG